MRYLLGMLISLLMMNFAQANSSNDYVLRLKCTFNNFEVIMFNSDSLVEPKFYQTQTIEDGDKFLFDTRNTILWAMSNPERGVMELKRLSDGIIINFRAVRFNPMEIGIVDTFAMIIRNDTISSGKCIIVFATRIN